MEREVNKKVVGRRGVVGKENPKVFCYKNWTYDAHWNHSFDRCFCITQHKLGEHPTYVKLEVLQLN